jgi:hypothetical protein
MLLQRNFLFVLPLRLLKISELRLVWTRPTRCLRDFTSFSVVGGASAVGWGSKSSVHRYRLVRFRFIQGIVASGRWGRSRRRSTLSPSNCSFASRVKNTHTYDPLYSTFKKIFYPSHHKIYSFSALIHPLYHLHPLWGSLITLSKGRFRSEKFGKMIL